MTLTLKEGYMLVQTISKSVPETTEVPSPASSEIIISLIHLNLIEV